MFGNYLKTAVRNLFGSLLYSAINILGLGIGLACCLLILLYVRHEFSYESGFAGADRIYRISREYYPDEGARARVPAQNNAPVTPALLEDFSRLEAVGRIYGGGLTVNRDELHFAEPELRFADQAIIDIFGFDWIAGTPDAALEEPNTIVLTRTLAEKIFNASDVAGRTVTFSDGTELRVTGVIGDLPPNTHLSLSGMVSMATLRAMVNESFFSQWNSTTDFHTYFLLEPGAAVGDIEAAIPDFIERHMGPEAAARSTMQVMNIRDIHLRSDRDEEWKPPGDIATVYSFAAIAGCILLIACINFMSIATARSTRRAKEVGMRKSIGASRAELVMQFLGESLLTAVSGMLVAVALVELLLPTMSAFAGVDLSVSYSRDSQVQLAILGLCLISGLVAGSYPALFLSAFSPARVLRGEQGGNRGLTFRNLLVIVQFTIAITIVIATFVVYSQREYALNMDLGFDRQGIVVVDTSARGGFREDWPLLRQKLLEDPAIEKVTASSFLPFGFNDNQYPLTLKGSSVNTRIQLMFTGYDFFSTYNIDFLAGRAFDERMMSEALAGAGTAFTARVILNREASRALGLEAGDAVNAELNIAGQVDAVVVGVVEDTHFESIHRNTRPLLFVLSPPEIPSPFTTYRTATIRFKAAAEQQALAHIADTWRELYPERELRSHYLDEDFRAMYLQEARQGQLFTWFSILAIVIACFGLFGLASFNAERRTKEIGVRKVMGSSTWRIVVLLTNDFSKLVLVSNVIAWPVAYVAMSRWLENFAYRIDLTPLIFIGSGLIALCVAWVTVGGTAAKAASRKPVLALRYE